MIPCWHLLYDRDWLDFNMIQSGHWWQDNPNYLKIAADYNRSPVKPCMDGEPRYEENSVNWTPGKGWYNDFDVRQAAYWPLYYYWYEAMNLPGGADMKHVKDLMLSRPFVSRIPDQTLAVATYEEGDHIQATRGDGYAFVYIP